MTNLEWSHNDFFRDEERDEQRQLLNCILPRFPNVRNLSLCSLEGERGLDPSRPCTNLAHLLPALRSLLRLTELHLRCRRSWESDEERFVDGGRVAGPQAIPALMNSLPYLRTTLLTQ